MSYHVFLEHLLCTKSTVIVTAAIVEWRSQRQPLQLEFHWPDCNWKVNKKSHHPQYSNEGRRPKTMSGPNQHQVRCLLRSLFRYTSKITNYNFRAHAMRRVKAGFAMNRTAAGSDLIDIYAFGQKQLDIAKRQSIVSMLYPDKMYSVMQTPKVRARKVSDGNTYRIPDFMHAP